MNFIEPIKTDIAKAIQSYFEMPITPDELSLTVTKKEFVGDYTLVMFPLIPKLKQKPEDIGIAIGNYLKKSSDLVDGYNIIKGFLNLELSDAYWHQLLKHVHAKESFGTFPRNGKKVMVEFSSPNTNKPLHLGHIRNILLGWSCAQILDCAGYDVVKVQIINDRGIAICKSMLAWQKYGNGATPETTGKKSDHFVGEFYVLFEQKFQEEYKVWQKSDAGLGIFQAKGKDDQTEEAFFKAYKNTYFNEHSLLGAEARNMLLDWEKGDADIMSLWRKMNEWVYNGFDTTYEALGVKFDKLYFESDTYLLGKDQIDYGLQENIFYKKDDGSVWIDLEDAKLDHKLVLRSDGTSVYMTQDIGTAELRYKDFGVDKMIYTVADEQNYHFKTLFEILKRLKRPYADGLYHLSYGMIDLPTGKMKSREGTIVDADDLIAETIEEARKSAIESGMISNLDQEVQEEIFRKVGLGALKFFIIKVNPQKRMTFDPKQSVDMQGQTGPYIQNAYVRIKSILGKSEIEEVVVFDIYKPSIIEKELLMKVGEFESIILEAADNYDPSGVANYCFSLAKTFHRFYHDHSIIKAESAEAKSFRLSLSKMVAHTLSKGMELLGIEMPERM